MEAGATDPGAGSEQSGDGPVTVLVVDDHAAFRSVVREVVARVPGFEVIGEVGSGEAAIEALENRPARLVLIDKRMPGMSGVEASRIIASRHSEVVIALSSVEDMDQQVVDECGAAAVIDKHRLSPRVLREIWEAHKPGGRRA